MTTSGVYQFFVSRDDIIRDAMVNMGKLGEGESPSPQETTDMARKLNMIVKQFQGKSDGAPGLKTWTRKRGFLFLHNTTGQYLVGPDAVGWTTSFVRTFLSVNAPAGANSITVTSVAGINNNDNIGIQISTGGGNGDIQWLKVTSVVGNVVNLNGTLNAQALLNATVYDYTTTAQNPLTIEAAVLRDNTNEDIPVRIFSSTQGYDALPSKTDINNISDPTQIYFQWNLQDSTVFTDVGAAQDMTKYLVLTYMEEEQIFVNPTDTPYYSAEWYLPLCWKLTKEGAPMFNAPWTSLMNDNYNEAMRIARKKQPENCELFFAPGEEP